MQIRPATADDLEPLDEIDATVEASDYLHVDRAGEGVELRLRTEVRPLRERRIDPNPVGDELRFAYKLVLTGMDDGLALFAEHDARPAAALLAVPRPGTGGENGTLDLLDVRVDYDFRRQGIGTAMLFQAITDARRRECRAIYAETPSNNLPPAGCWKSSASTSAAWT